MELSDNIEIFLMFFITTIAIVAMDIAASSLQHGYIVMNYNTEKIVATSEYTHRERTMELPLYFDKYETTFSYNGIEVTSDSEEIYHECEKGSSYQAIIEIATNKKNGKKLYFLKDIADVQMTKS